VIPPLGGYTLNWLADAEISCTPGQAAKSGLSFFFTDDIEYERFCCAAQLPGDAVERAASIRARFDLVPRHWVKLHYQDGQRSGTSQYFVLDPRNVYPITTLRLCLKQCGLTSARGLEPAFEPALGRSDTLWGVIAKQSDAGVCARISCRVERSLLAELFARVARLGYVAERLAAKYLERDAAIEAGAHAYLSLDPDVPDSCSVDYEGVAPASVPEACKPLWPAGDAREERRYLKCRLEPRSGEPQWTVYRPLPAVLTEEQLDRLCADGDDGGAYRARVRAYYDGFNETIVREVGATYQAGLIKAAQSGNAAAVSNRYLAERAGLVPGQRLLDAGCGTGGPSIDACRTIPGLQVDAITISPQQASTARRLIREAGLEDRIRVHVADYHALPFGTAVFDRIWFLEAIGYADDPGKLFAEALRVLCPGGSVYIKDVFRRGGGLIAAERLELAEFDRVYVQRTPSVEETAEAVRRAGFRDVEVTDLSGRVSMEAFNRAMLQGRRVRSAELSAFGRHHYRSFKRLPVTFAEIRAAKR
jgi:cyclopropane fatty-acyl-phospholipid synthase-like methyltransferase